MKNNEITKSENVILLNGFFKFLDDFKVIYEREKGKLPYHINLIDELHANENAHSRILSKILQYKENDKFPFLDDFLKKVCGFKLCIDKPVVMKVDSCGHIDIPIFDTEYVVIIENKVKGADEQNNEYGGQLARYIESVNKNYSIDKNKIYVVYTPKYKGEPSDDCWINDKCYSYKYEFRSRFISISYRDVIYPWLKEQVLSFKNEKDKYLSSAIFQYIDHLEGEFSLRSIDMNMNRELQGHIKKEFELEDDIPENALNVLSQKKDELNAIIVQIEHLRIEYISKQFKIWQEKLVEDYPHFEKHVDNFKLYENYINVGVKFSIEEKELLAIIEWSVKDNPEIYYGVYQQSEIKDVMEKLESLTEILNKHDLAKPEKKWLGWKETTFENAYNDLKNLIEDIIKLIHPEYEN